jgi:hypothetical protein
MICWATLRKQRKKVRNSRLGKARHGFGFTAWRSPTMGRRGASILGVAAGPRLLKPHEIRASERARLEVNRHRIRLPLRSNKNANSDRHGAEISIQGSPASRAKIVSIQRPSPRLAADLVARRPYKRQRTAMRGFTLGLSRGGRFSIFADTNDGSAARWRPCELYLRRLSGFVVVVCHKSCLL